MITGNNYIEGVCAYVELFDTSPHERDIIAKFLEEFSRLNENIAVDAAVVPYFLNGEKVYNTVVFIRGYDTFPDSRALVEATETLAEFFSAKAEYSKVRVVIESYKYRPFN